jgi:hypothetical protein
MTLERDLKAHKTKQGIVVPQKLLGLLGTTHQITGELVHRAVGRFNVERDAKDPTNALASAVNFAISLRDAVHSAVFSLREIERVRVIFPTVPEASEIASRMLLDPNSAEFSEPGPLRSDVQSHTFRKIRIPGFFLEETVYKPIDGIDHTPTRTLMIVSQDYLDTE